MPQVQRVWRHLLYASAHGQRRWPSVTALATELGVPVSTTHRSLTHPVAIGAVIITAGAGGLDVLDPVRLLTLFAGHRHLARDITRRHRVDLPAPEVERLATNPETVLGGFGAVVAHHDGINRIANYDTVLFYGDPGLPADLPVAAAGEGTEVVIATADPLLPRYGRVTPYAQAYADLFALPGWQAARFTDTLDPHQITRDRDTTRLV